MLSVALAKTHCSLGRGARGGAWPTPKRKKESHTWALDGAGKAAPPLLLAYHAGHKLSSVFFDAGRAPQSCIILWLGVLGGIP